MNCESMAQHFLRRSPDEELSDTVLKYVIRPLDRARFPELRGGNNVLIVMDLDDVVEVQIDA